MCARLIHAVSETSLARSSAQASSEPPGRSDGMRLLRGTPFTHHLPANDHSYELWARYDDRVLTKTGHAAHPRVDSREGIRTNGTEMASQSQCQTGDFRKIFNLVGELLSSAADPSLRRTTRDFSRDGTLTPDLLVVILLFMAGDSNRRGYRHILDAFWDECASHDVPLPRDRPVTGAAFCQARAKLPSELLRKVLHEVADKMEAKLQTAAHWKGRRVLAVDGTKMNLQRSLELDQGFGRPEGGHAPQATVSALVNVMTQAPCDIVIDRYGACERQMLVDHLDVLRPHDVLIMDRGYPSHEVLRLLISQRIDFLVRVPAANSFAALDEFRFSGAIDRKIVIGAARDARCGETPIELRAIKLTNPTGEESFYLTTLCPGEVSRAEIVELYRLRWQAEEYFKLEKSLYFDQRQFHAKSAQGIRQEILAQAIYVVVARFLLAVAAEHVNVDRRELSVKSAVLALAVYLTRLCLDDPARAVHCLPRMLERIASPGTSVVGPRENLEKPETRRPGGRTSVFDELTNDTREGVSSEGQSTAAAPELPGADRAEARAGEQEA